jgi:hypothetical protein
MEQWLAPGALIGLFGLFATLLTIATADLRRRIEACEKDRKDLRTTANRQAIEIGDQKEREFKLLQRIVALENK